MMHTKALLGLMLAALGACTSSEPTAASGDPIHNTGIDPVNGGSLQGMVSVSDHDTPETLSERILEVEHRIYPDALRLLASGAVQLDGDVCKTPDSAGSGNFLISPVASADGVSS